MGNSIRANHNLIAVSAYFMENGINIFQALDLCLLANVGNIITLEPRRESNKDEMTGKEEADAIYDLGATATLPLTFDKAQPQHFAFLYAYALGLVSSTAAGSGFLKTITPMDGDLERSRSLPSLTAGQRHGKTVVKERYASMFVNTVTSNFSRDAFCKASGDLVGTGKYEASVIQETVSAPENSTTLTLAANGVAGSTAEERLAAIHQVKYESAPGVWTDVEYTAVSSAAPAEITITAPGAGTEAKAFKVLYAPTEVAWMTFPPRVSESPLRVSELRFVLGGTYDGTAIQGGRDMSSDVNSIEHRLANNGKCEFVPGAGGAYASQYFREGREQTLVLDREFRDYIIQHFMTTNEYFAASVLAEGREYETGHNYSVELIFPRLGVLKAPVTVNGKRLAEKGDMAVLEDGVHGSVIVKVKNMAANYAAAA